MLLSKTVVDYEKKLKYLIRQDASIYQVKTLLKEATQVCRNEYKTLRYLRLWLYLAILVKSPLSIYQYLLDNHIGTSFALLYQDIAYYHAHFGRKDEAQKILLLGITHNAKPQEDLQHALLNLNRPHSIYISPPSIKCVFPKQQQQQVLAISLESNGIFGMLDAMKAYIRQTSRMATLRYCQHYDLSFEECRALLHVPRVTESENLVAIKQELDRKYDHQEPPRHQSIIQPDQYQDISQQDLLFLQESPVINQQTHSKPLEHRSMIQSLERFELEQQENIDTREQEPIIISVPLAYEDKQSLVVSQLMNDTTYDLVNSVSQNSLRILKRKPLIPFTSQGLPFSLGQEMIDVHGYLDEGKYGTVYVVKWRNRPMALKIHKQVDRWEHYMHQFIYQQCPQADRFFLRSHALYLDHHHSYSIMDYASQGTLLKCLNVFRQLDERAVPEALVQLLVLRILQAIYVLHEAHIVHLDLKLDNLLMDYSLPGMAPTQQNNHNNNTFLGPVPAYTSSHPFWQNISIKVIDFGLALNLDLFNNATRTPILAKAVWKPRVKNDMPSIVAGLPWLPYQLDYWGIANCAHSLLFSGPMVNAKHNQPKRYWNQSLWLSFFTSLASSPPSTLDMGLQTFRKLINDFEVSLATGNLKDRVINDLLKYHQYLTKVK